LSDRLVITIIAGCPIRSEETKPYIGAFIIRPDVPVEIYRKRVLDGDEVRHFIPSTDAVVRRCHDTPIGIAIRADINNPAHAAGNGATVYAAGVAITPKGVGRALTYLVVRGHDGEPAQRGTYFERHVGLRTSTGNEGNPRNVEAGDDAPDCSTTRRRFDYRRTTC